MPSHSASARGICIGLYKAGQSVQQIKASLGWSTSTVYYTIRRYLNRQSVVNLPRSGRPSKLSPQDKRQLLRDITKHHYEPFIAFTEKYRISVSTVRRIAAADGLHRFIRRRKPFLTACHREKRRAWAAATVHQDWKNVLFTDEASFQLGWRPREWTTRRKGEGLLEKHLAPKFCSGRQTVMVWTGVAHGRKLPLYFFAPGSVTGTRYAKEVVAGPLRRGVESLSRTRAPILVVEDNAPIHRAQIAQTARAATGITLLTHPPCSPDLNPIENLWALLKYAVSCKPKASTLDELIAQIRQAWKELPIQVVNKVIATMPARRAIVQQTRGGHTKY